MTSDPIEAYGGITFPASLLRSLAQKLDGSQVPFHLDHDLTKPIRIRDVKIYVRDRSDGISELRFRAEMHADEMHFLDSRPGISATVMSPLARDEHVSRKVDSQIQLSADHAWFEDEVLICAEGRLLARRIPTENLRVERAYQFSAVPDPQIFLDVAYPLLLSVGAGALWDGIKVLFARRRTPRGGDASVPTTVNIEIRDGSRTFRAVVTSSDEAVAEAAIRSLDSAVAEFQRAPHDALAVSPDPTAVASWDESNRRWTPPS